MMLKAMMLAKWFNLSDPGLEEALLDRISFRKFVGLSFADATPDETTFVFRKRLREAKLDEYLFQSVVKHLGSQGFSYAKAQWSMPRSSSNQRARRIATANQHAMKMRVSPSRTSSRITATRSTSPATCQV